MTKLILEKTKGAGCIFSKADKKKLNENLKKEFNSIEEIANNLSPPYSILTTQKVTVDSLPFTIKELPVYYSIDFGEGYDVAKIKVID